MLVSIIVPVYNVEQYVEVCLRSVLSQTYDRLEVIIVNDHSQDNSMQIVDKVLSTHYRSSCVRLINHECNKGLSSARNTGILASNGEFIYFLDSDDYITDNCIQLLVNSSIKYNSEIVLGDVFIKGARHFHKWFDFHNIPECYDSNFAIKRAYYNNLFYMMAWNKLIKRSFIIDNDLFFKENIIHEDDHWSFYVFRSINRLSIVNRDTYIYILRDDSIMGNSKIVKSIDSRIKITNDFFNTLANNYDILDASYVISYAFSLLKIIQKLNYYDRILFNKMLTRNAVASRIIVTNTSFKSKIYAFIYMLPLNIRSFFVKLYIYGRSYC